MHDLYFSLSEVSSLSKLLHSIPLAVTCTLLYFLFILQGIENYCKVENGYTSIGNVRSTIDTKPKDKMESFFLGETLKYLYLLFMEDQSAFSVDKWVFNSEAHPLPIYTH